MSSCRNLEVTPKNEHGPPLGLGFRVQGSWDLRFGGGFSGLGFGFLAQGEAVVGGSRVGLGLWLCSRSIQRESLGLCFLCFVV